ncbi:LicD family protein [Gemella bergeri]|uniref:LicD family protein n=1 Tax=Gemella bergeri TaxID=84136 RepID=UPI0003FE0FB2|nr:LicD family protein [Gemella bergeri]
MGIIKLMTLKELQGAYLELLIEFDSLCKEYNLRYDLCGGSMLGAVRHQGFIPWDDDIDVAMPRMDYEKLLELNITNSLIISDDRKIISNRDKSFARHFSRYIRKDIGRIDEMAEKEDCPYIGIDIFVVDGIPSNKSLFNIQVFIIKQLRRLLLTSVERKNTSRRGKFSAKVKNLYRPILKKIGSYNLVNLLESVCKIVKFEDAEYVGIITGMYGKKEKWLKKEMLPQKEYLFEKYKVKGYANYDIYLTNLYGNYRKLPPKDKQVAHNSKGYRIDKNLGEKQ